MDYNNENEKHENCGCGKHNRGITCDVRNCAYHDGDCYCTAQKIAVGPSFATSCSDTVCATFKQRSFS